MARHSSRDGRPQGGREHGRLVDYIPAVAMAAGTFAAITYMTVFVMPPDAQVAVVFPPWSDRQDSWAAVFDAGGLIVDEHFGGTVLLVQPDQEGFADRVTAAGAWAVLNPLGFGGCGSGPPTRPGRPPAH